MKRWTLIAIVCVAAPLSAQRSDRPARVDVVSVKPIHQPDDSRRLPCGLPPVERTGGRVHIPLSQLCGLIRIGYEVADYQVAGIPLATGVGPSNFFETDVRLEGGAVPTVDQTRLIVQAVLAERFKLHIHRESQERPIYVLAPTGNGPRLTPCSDPRAPSGYTPGRITSCNPPIPMARLLQFLSSETGRPVLDRTGLKDPMFELRWLPALAEPQPDSPPVLVTAIQEQLGLKLEPQRGPIAMVVVDSVAVPSSN